jgi:PAS domain S-box-containing protein
MGLFTRPSILKGIKSDGNEYTALRKDGSKFPIAIHTNPVIRENNFAGVRGIIIDLTEQKHAEKEQKKLQAQLQRA